MVTTESGDPGSKRKSCASWPSPKMMVMSQGGGDRDLFLKRSRDIEYAKQHGYRISTALFNLVICQTDIDGSRVGIVVGKRFGGAVSRNRAKRLFRELTRQLRGQLIPGHALVVFPKRDSIAQPFAVLKEVWVSTLQRQRLLQYV
ncbi:MAG: ribonuclease P protein component [Nitrospiraceae bacterium]|nr:MAG: ribonuclease P protein component [Nitrospiraceae bacterium]